MPGRPARIIKSELCRPPIFAFRLLMPVVMPDTWPPLLSARSATCTAAVEAARAGDAGKGFAVVAEEVRVLAEQSSASAKEIYRLISEVQSESGKAVSVMGRSRQEFLTGQKVVNEVGTYFRNIIEKVQELGDQIQSVAAAAQQMSASVQNVTEIAKDQSSSVQELSALSEELAGMAETMAEITARFKH